jgi:LacI family transcriptional regulator
VITGDPWQDAARSRLNGYRRALWTSGMRLDPSYVRVGRWSHASGAEATHGLMALPSPPDAILCQNDSMARGALSALRALGRRVPDEVAVIGYDDRDFARDLDPPLTTVLLPLTEMARRAVEFLVRAPRANRVRVHRMKVACPLVLRASG